MNETNKEIQWIKQINENNEIKKNEWKWMKQKQWIQIMYLKQWI